MKLSLMSPERVGTMWITTLPASFPPCGDVTVEGGLKYVHEGFFEFPLVALLVEKGLEAKLAVDLLVVVQMGVSCSADGSDLDVTNLSDFFAGPADVSIGDNVDEFGGGLEINLWSFSGPGVEPIYDEHGRQGENANQELSKFRAHRTSPLFTANIFS
jgi:hypothetical protein